MSNPRPATWFWIAAGVLLLYGLCPKFGALLVALPRSVLGGVFVIVCGSIVVLNPISRIISSPLARSDSSVCNLR